MPEHLTAPSANKLDRSLVSSLAWNAAAKWTAQVVSWASTIIVARLLTPFDYGLVGMAGFYLTLAAVVSQSGIADAIVAKRDLSREKLSQLNTVAILVGLGLVAISFVLARPLALFFGAPQVELIVKVASATYILNASSVVPRALLQKELRFKLLASIDTIRVTAQLLCTVLLAWKGFGYWSLVYSHVLGTFVGAALVYYWRVHPFAVPQFGKLREEISFSTHVLTSAIGSYWYTNADFLVAGKMLGQIPLGNYTVAWTISSAPVDKVTDLVTGITPAYFSAVQNDNAELRRYLLRLTEALSYLTLPLSLGVALLADYFVPVVLGTKWMGVIPSLRLLVMFVAFRSIATLLPRVLTAIGDARFVMYVTAFSSILLPVSFVIGSHWNAPGIAAAWMFIFPITTLPLFYKLFHRIELSAESYVSSIAPAAVSSLIMSGFVIGARLGLPPNWSMTLRLAVAVAVGVLSYSASLLLFYRERVTKYVDFYSRMKRQ